MTDCFRQDSPEEAVLREENGREKESESCPGGSKTLPSFDVLIPTYKPGEKFRALLSALEEQEYPPEKIIIVNTEERYFPKELLEGRKVEVSLHHIKREDFDHAYARNLAASFSCAEYFLTMTDDAVPADKKLTKELLTAFSWDNRIAEVYARQLCTKDSSFDEVLSRSFNYGEKPEIKGIEDVKRLGIKCFFASNVCCMYKKAVFRELQGFQSPTIFNEDMIFAARAEKAGYKVAYNPMARVYHSHHYTAVQQFRRNFDLGVSHRDFPEIFSLVPPEREGMKMFKQNARTLVAEGKALLLLPLFFRTGARFLGYKAGKNYPILPRIFRNAITLNPQYFDKKGEKS